MISYTSGALVVNEALSAPTVHTLTRLEMKVNTYLIDKQYSDRRAERTYRNASLRWRRKV